MEVLHFYLMFKDSVFLCNTWIKNMQGWKNLFKNISVYQKIKAIKTIKRKSSGDRFIKGRKLWT